MKTHFYLIFFKLFIASFILLSGCSKEQTETSTTETTGHSLKSTFPVWAGGFAGLSRLTEASASNNFRALGGYLYIHHNGWVTECNDAQRKQILVFFSGNHKGIELGYSTDPDQWVNAWNNFYKPYGIVPEFITANCFANNNMPVVSDWQNYVNLLKKASSANHVYPTFECQNFKTGADLLNNRVSKNETLQKIIRISGGLTIDSPSRYFFLREDAYRTWVIDAIKWTKGVGLTAIVIMSPNLVASTFASESERYYNFLVSQNAKPSGIVCENYNDTPGDKGMVAPDDDVRSSLHVGCLMRKK